MRSECQRRKYIILQKEKVINMLLIKFGLIIIFSLVSCFVFQRFFISTSLFGFQGFKVFSDCIYLG